MIQQFGTERADADLARRYHTLDYTFRQGVSKGAYPHYVDDTTWLDLDFDQIFEQMNHTHTGIGEASLYKMLRTPGCDAGRLAWRQRMMTYYTKESEDRVRTQIALMRLGVAKRYSVFEYIDRLMTAVPHKPVLSVVTDLLIFLTLGLAAGTHAAWIMVTVALLVLNIYHYYRYKQRGYFEAFGYVAKIARCARDLQQCALPLDAAQKELFRTQTAKLYKLGRLAWIFKQGSDLGGTALDLLMDYVKMLLHVDIIIFELSLKRSLEIREDIEQVMEMIGEIDTAIAMASYCRQMQSVTIPVLHAKQEHQIAGWDIEGVYHPLVKKPVKNDLHVQGHILLTGSNASGKSTFLKAMAVNAILAQSCGFVLADAWEGPYVQVYTSMRHGDSIAAGDSYFMAELKAIKRIYDQLEGDSVIFCVLDEVLSGTNTVERIAAASQILHCISEKNCICCAATHDLELAELLKSVFANYHFSEQLTDQGVTFDYTLKEGPSDTRNAIELLKQIGFEPEVVTAALESARRYETEGRWSL